MMSAQDGVLGQVLKVLQKITPIADEAMAEFLISLCCDSNGIKEFEQKLEENEAPFEHETIEEIYDICNSGRKGSVKREKTVIKRESDDIVKLEQLDDGGIIKREPVVKLEYNDHISNVKGEQPNGYSNRKYDYNEKKNSVKKEEDDEVDEFGRSIKSRYRRDKELPEESVSYKHVDLYDSAPTEGKVYQGRVVNITNFGAFVRLSSIRPQGSQRYVDGLCHISQISTERIEHPSDIVSVNETVYVKIVKIDGKRISLSMKNVDQITGQEVKPADEYDRHRGRQKNVGERRPKRALTSPERWELRQLISSGAISIKEHPELEEDLNDFTADINLEPEVEVDIEVKQEEPPFLVDQKSHLKSIGDGDLDSLKIVQKPNGSLNRAAMNGSQLAKELKERKLKELREKRLKAISEKRKKGATEDDPFNQNSNGQSDKQAEEELSVLSEWQKANMKQKISYGKRTEAPIDEQRRSLPVYKMRTKLLDIVRDNQFIVIVGETGSGKTTQITQYLAEDGFAKHGMIGCTQPRRVAAVSVAKRVSEEVGCKLGEEVGYFIRFEDVTSRNTKIKYMTDGMLQREALIDPDMSRYSVIMLDEAHERTIATDVLFALLKKAAQKRPDLKVIVTSATLDADKFSKYFYNCPILKIPGRTFPVEILYTKEPEFDYLAACLDTVLQIHISEPAGDILVFLTGQEEIDTACEALFERVKSLGKSIPELIILPVYSSLPSEVQSRIFEPTPKGSRKCVIATNIAETSITIDGIFYVIDPGFVKINAYDSKLGMDSLVVSPISQAQANQRAGRAGRTGPGKCYRLYTENAYKNEMVPNTVPEIQRQNLSNTILMLKAMGIDDLIHFDFMDPPPMKTMMVALEELYNLSALDENGYLTKLGKKMADFPMDPSLAKSLISSVELRCSDELSTIVAMLSVQTVFYRPKNKQQQADMKKSKFNNVNGDHLTLLNTYNAWVQNNYSKKWCEENYVQERSLKRARDVRNQLIKIFVKYRHRIDSCGRDYDRIRKALCSGFFKNSAKRDSQESGAYKTLIENTPVYMHPSSALFGKRAEHVIYHTLLLTSREYMHCVTTIEPKWLVEVAPTFFKIGDPNSKNRKNEKIVSLSSKKRKLQRQ